MRFALSVRRSNRSAFLRCLALAAALTAALVALMSSGVGPGPGRMERSSFRGGAGYWLLAKDGGVFAFGDAQYFGPNRNQGNDIAGMAATATGNGYWTADDDGDVFAYGDAVDYGSRPGPEIDNITGFAARPQGDGYWMVANDGSVYAFGAATYAGSANTLRLSKPIIGMAATPSGAGYWLIGADGGVFAYGDAKFFGSTGAIKLNRPIVDFAPSPDGKGYRFIGSDGGVFAYGSAGFFGSTGAMRLNQSVVGFAGTASGNGYWLTGQDGGVFAFGDAPFYGSTGGIKLNASIVAIVATPRIKVAPVARDDARTVDEDGSVTVDVEANDTHALPAAVSVNSNPAHGTAAMSGTKVVYTPSANYNGSDSFTYKLTDTAGHSATAAVTITVTPVDDLPAAVADSASVNEDTPVVVSVLANDTGLGDGGIVVVTSSPVHGAAVVNGNNTVTFTPAANYNGPASFAYTVTDTDGDTSGAAVSITVAPVNDAPTISSIADLSTPEDTSTAALPFTVGDLETAPGSLTMSGSSSNTTLVPNANIVFGGSLSTRTVTVTPAADKFGTATITVTVSDGSLSSNEPFVLTVTPVDDLPAAVADSASVNEDTPVVVSVLANDTGLGDGGLVVVTSSPVHGAAVVNGNNTVTFTPAANYNGPASFAYTVTDTDGDTSGAAVSITVAPVNDAPVATAGSGSTPEDTQLTASVLTGTDVESSPLTFAKVSDPTHGAVTVNANGTFTYTPTADYNGPDSFTFKANDGTVDSAPATFSITVNPVNDAPVAASGSASTTVLTPINGSVTATDVDNDPLTYSLVDDSFGTLDFRSNGTFTYTPSPLMLHGTDSFTFKANDGAANSNTATFTIHVGILNGPPVAIDDFDTTVGGTAVVNVVANDSDPDTDILTADVAVTANNGTVICVLGVCTYTADVGFHGTDTFTYTLSDPFAATDTGTVTITVP